MSGAIIIELPGATSSENAADTLSVMTNSEEAFKDLFVRMYKTLHYYAFTIVREETAAEEVVQTVFCRLWERKDRLLIRQTTEAYLYKAVYNESLNYLKTTRIRNGHQRNALQATGLTETADTHDLQRLRQQLQAALESLPERCRTVFQLSRMENMKYREIAETLGISVKTVEAQMARAFRILREKLSDYLPVIWLSITILNDKL